MAYSCVNATKVTVSQVTLNSHLHVSSYLWPEHTHVRTQPARQSVLKTQAHNSIPPVTTEMVNRLGKEWLKDSLQACVHICSR